MTTPYLEPYIIDAEENRSRPPHSNRSELTNSLWHLISSLQQRTNLTQIWPWIHSP